MRWIPAALLAVTALLSGCAGTQQRPVYLERANVLPVSIDDRFQFRKQQLFFNDPRFYVETTSESMRFFRMRMNHGAVTPRDIDEVTAKIGAVLKG